MIPESLIRSPFCGWKMAWCSWGTKIYCVLQIKFKSWFKKMSTWSLTYKHSDFTVANIFQSYVHKHTHTHSHLTALFPGLPRWAGARKVKPIWILLKQEIVSGSGFSWAICKSAHRFRQVTTPAPHHSVFLQAGCLSCRPIKALKAQNGIKNQLA